MLFLNPFLCLFMSVIISFMIEASIPWIIPLLSAIIIASLCYIIKKRSFIPFIMVIYLVVCCISISFLAYLPLIVYMLIEHDTQPIYDVSFFIPFIFHLQDTSIYLLTLICIMICLAIGLKKQYLKGENMRLNYLKQRDATQELAMLLSEKNHDLLIQQEQEIRIATLDERNRIAREIHDNVGHLLSSSLLQIGALLILEKDETKKEALLNLKTTLSNAMDSVRNSVHDLHVDALDMEVMIQKLLSNFTFCEVAFEYDVIHPFQQKVIYHIAAIMKECLNNTMKHSNATKLSIVIREQPAFYQIIIHDNGTKAAKNGEGIGLVNIKERVDDLHGYVNINADEGFQIFITLPKEEAICEY